jgi:hypothetical protein
MAAELAGSQEGLSSVSKYLGHIRSPVKKIFSMEWINICKFQKITCSPVTRRQLVILYSYESVFYAF